MKCNKTFKSKLIYALITIAVILSLFVVERVNRFANDGDVGVIISNMDNPFFSTVTRSIHHTLQDGGHDVVVFSSKDDPLRSIQSMENLVDRGFKVIIFNPVDSLYTKKEVDYARKNGVKLITIDRKAIGENVLSHIESDNIKGGRLAAEYILSRLGDNANVLEIQGLVKASSTQERTKAFTETIANGGSKILITEAANYDRLKAKQVTSLAIKKHPEINAIFAQNDLMALGAADALDQLGIGKVVIVGYDGTLEGLDGVKTGRISATIKQQPYKIGEMAAKVAMDYLQGSKESLNQEYRVDVDVYSNSREKL